MAKNEKHKVFPVTGMMCAVCAGTVEKTVGDVPGVISVSVNFASSSVAIDWNSSETSPEVIAEAVRSAGYDMIVSDSEAEAVEESAKKEEEEYRKMKGRTLIAWILTIPMSVLCMAHLHFPGEAWVYMGVTLIVMSFCGSGFYRRGFKALAAKAPNMDSLVAISTIVSFLFSLFNTLSSLALTADLYYEGAAMIITFVLTGKLMELRSRHSTGLALKALIGMQPSEADLVLSDGSVRPVAVSSLRRGDKIRVRQGERVPVDGIVIDGEAVLDESMLTGEPIGVEKKPGDKVSAGTIISAGHIIIEAEKVGAETELSRIITAVKEAQGSKAPVQRLVDKVSRVFVPSVMAISVVTFIIWLIIGHGELSVAIVCAVSVLVIACPCALGLATPMAVMVSIGNGAGKGILIKNAEALEMLAKIDTLLIDKTGTLTEGKPEVTGYVFSNDDVKERSASGSAEGVVIAAEQRSIHPLSTAIINFLSQRPYSQAQLTAYDYVAGKGIFCEADGHKYRIGAPGIEIMKMDGMVAEAVRDYLNEGAGTVVVEQDGTPIMAFRIEDRLRHDAIEAVRSLEKMGIEVELLTGDKQPTADHIAKIAGINTVTAGVLPREKQKRVEDLRQEGKIVAMAGDGINDSAALASADVSIAMGGGSDIAIDVAMLTIVGGKLSSIPKAVKLSKATLKIIHENLFWAFIYNVIGIPLAAGVLYKAGFLLTPMFASAAMALSSLCVVMNSLRLRKA
ncbi:MAG: heavy metal translocating P-type ATPase [Muribaculaceae bacterium]|nr:heavy metal translocating P-type ATPase [Muribaculaceae bacterium]